MTTGSTASSSATSVKKSLLICSHYPLPEANGSCMRTMHFVRFFEQLGPVDIAYTYGEPDDQTAVSPFRRELRLDLQPSQDFKKQVLLGAVERRPYPVYRYTDKAAQLLTKAVDSEQYDYILMRYLYPSDLLFRLPESVRSRVIVDIDDVLSGSVYTQMVGTSDHPVKRALIETNRALLRAHERRCLRTATCLVCSETDRDKLRLKDAPPAEVVPNIYVPPVGADRVRPNGFANPHHLLFVGSLDYRPNVEGLQWFIDSVWPRFRDTYDGARFSVVGRNPGSDVERLCAASPGVELHPNAPDVRPFYDAARAVVVPLLAGGGTRIKILESAIEQRPVLSTPIGAEGIDLIDTEGILMFSDAATFLRSYDMLNDHSRYDRITHNALATVTSKYSKQSVDDTMLTLTTRIDQHVHTS